MARTIALTKQNYRNSKRGEVTCSGCLYGVGYDQGGGRRGLCCANTNRAWPPTVGTKKTCDKAKPRKAEVPA